MSSTTFPTPGSDHDPVGLRAGQLTMSVGRHGRERTLTVRAADEVPLRDFEGHVTTSDEEATLVGPLSERNADAVRKHARWLTPQPLGLRTSVGVGDRLGLATPGHVRAFQRFENSVAPVFAQQSIREMTRTGRTPRQVIDDATFGCVEAGWRYAVGADADHVQDVAPLERCLSAGFTLFSIDPGRHVVELKGRSPSATDVAAVPWEALEDDRGSMIKRYGTSLDLGDTVVPVEEQALVAAAVKYGRAVVHASGISRYLHSRATRPIEVEVCVDETAEVTTPLEHAYLATELARLGVQMVSFAPRYSGTFQKGVSFQGDLDAFTTDFHRHAHLARVLGPYKMSLHSGSDKFELYDMAYAATGGAVHLKTSGTSYLEALAVVGAHEPETLLEVYRVSRDAYAMASATYQVTTDVTAAPGASELDTTSVARILSDPTTRQVLHVGYGDVLGAAPGSANHDLALAVREVLEVNAESYARGLEAHLLRHLTPFGAGS
jgi:hypothetical protein